MVRGARPRVLMLATAVPRPTGNGLAMRGWLQLHGALAVADVHLVVVPFWGADANELPALPGLLSATRITPDELMAGLRGGKWTVDYPLPWGLRVAQLYKRALRSLPLNASKVLPAAADDEIAGVLSLQLGMAPLGAAVAKRLDRPLIVDVADDDEAFLRGAGMGRAAAWVGRIVEQRLPKATFVTTPSAADAVAIAARHDLGSRVRVVPNAVRLPDIQTPPRPGIGRIVFLGTLTYSPNVDAARWLVREVSPRISQPHRIDLVGRAGRSVLALGSETVTVQGAVPSVEPFYAGADIVVAPLLSGSGTRIKILEAFAHRRPVVSTTLGAAGIEAQHERHLLLADSAPTFAEAVDRLLEGADSTAMVDAAYRLVAERYEFGAVTEQIGELLMTAITPG